MIGRRRNLTILAVLQLALLVLGAPTSALAKCNPHRSNNGQAYWAGWHRSTSSYWGGIYSNLLNYSPWVASGSDTSAWTMLTLQSGGTNWAQVGWWEEAGDVRHTFTQYTWGGQWHTTFWAPKSVNSYTYYTTLYDDASHLFHFEVAGSSVQSANADFRPNASQVMGEIHSLASQMPGGTSAPEWFKDTWIWSNGTWIAFNGTSTGSQTYWVASKSSSLNLKTYDKACST